jgi:hypothetical protein
VAPDGTVSGGFSISGVGVKQTTVTISGNVINNGGGQAFDSSGNQYGGFSINNAKLVVNGSFINNGTFSGLNGELDVFGDVKNLGTWWSDFTYDIKGNFTNSGTLTSSSQDIWQFSGTGTQIFDLGNTNLTIGSLFIAPGVVLDLIDGTLTVGGGPALLPGNYIEDANGRIISSTVPIPGAVWLLGAGLAGLVGFRRKLKK